MAGSDRYNETAKMQTNIRPSGGRHQHDRFDGVFTKLHALLSMTLTGKGVWWNGIDAGSKEDELETVA